MLDLYGYRPDWSEDCYDVTYFSINSLLARAESVAQEIAEEVIEEERAIEDVLRKRPQLLAVLEDVIEDIDSIDEMKAMVKKLRKEADGVDCIGFLGGCVCKRYEDYLDEGDIRRTYHDDFTREMCKELENKVEDRIRERISEIKARIRNSRTLRHVDGLADRIYQILEGEILKLRRCRGGIGDDDTELEILLTAD